MTREDYKMNLWNEFMEGNSFILERDRESLGKIAGCYANNTEFLLQVYEALIEKERFLEDEKNKVSYERDGEDYILSYDGKECVYTKADFHRLLASMLDILEDTLPLGSVVDLKKSAYKDMPDINKIKSIRIVITQRFLGREEDRHYFPYAGVVYPTGMLGRKEVLYFTRPLVEKVVSRGYSDLQEEAYVYLMKNELINEKQKNSFGYATKEEIETFNANIKLREGIHGR